MKLSKECGIEYVMTPPTHTQIQKILLDVTNSFPLYITLHVLPSFKQWKQTNHGITGHTLMHPVSQCDECIYLYAYANWLHYKHEI